MLTIKQQELVSKHHNLIYRCLHKMNIPINNWDDYYGVCAEGLCIAAEKYKNSKNKFSTLAMDIMVKKVIDELRRNHCVKRGNGIECLHLEKENVIYDCNTYNEFEQNAITKYTFSRFIELLNSREKEIVLLIFEGFTYEEIAVRLHISKSSVGKSMKKIRRLYLYETS